MNSEAGPSNLLHEIFTTNDNNIEYESDGTHSHEEFIPINETHQCSDKQLPIKKESLRGSHEEATPIYKIHQCSGKQPSTKNESLRGNNIRKYHLGILKN